jgi:SAM-dependent methyltransferase
MNVPTRLHLGCGLNTPPGWIHVDGSWSAMVAKFSLALRALAKLGLIGPEQTKWSPDIVVHDLRKRLPFRDCSMDAVYASHVLEHLHYVDGRMLLADVFRVLRPEGVVRLVVPDLRAILREYMGERPFGELKPEHAAMSKADRVNARLMCHQRARPRGSVIYRLYTTKKNFHTHFWMYDAESLSLLMCEVGFVHVAERAFRDSRIQNIAGIEMASRVLNSEGICVEGVKASVLS